MRAQVRNWQIIEASSSGATTLENRIDLGIATVRAVARCEAASGDQTDVRISRVFADVAGREVDIQKERDRDEVGFVRWLYVDERVRVTVGSKGSLFVHLREA